MIRLMRSSRVIRHAWVMFALAAFALRAVIPVGYMLGTDPDTGETRVLLCQQDSGGLPADWVNPFEPEPHHPDQEQQNSGCAFALTGTSLLPGAPTVVTASQNFSVVVTVPINVAAVRPAALNPTARPRAPPSLRV